MSSSVKSKLTERIPPHRILREILRHYLEFRDLVSSTGNSVIEHGYFVYDDNDDITERVNISFSFWDLMDILRPQEKGGVLSDRKIEAIFYNVIFDKKQKEVADIMGITTVSVGQYVEQGMIQLSNVFFADVAEVEE